MVYGGSPFAPNPEYPNVSTKTCDMRTASHLRGQTSEMKVCAAIMSRISSPQERR